MVSKNSAAHHSKKDSSEFPHHFNGKIGKYLGTPWNSHPLKPQWAGLRILRYHMVPHGTTFRLRYEEKNVDSVEP